MAVSNVNAEEKFAADLASLTTALVDAAEQQTREEVALRIARVIQKARREEKAGPVEKPAPLSFDTNCGLYTFAVTASGVDRLDVFSQLTARMSQLRSMLTIIHGNGGECFDGWSQPIKDNYLWACSMIADECSDLVGELQRTEPMQEKGATVETAEAN